MAAYFERLANDRELNRPVRKSALLRLTPAFLAILLSFSVSCVSAEDLPDLGESARAELSPQLERKVGEKIMNEIRRAGPVMSMIRRSTTT